jgi:hypothetical protein
MEQRQFEIPVELDYSRTMGDDRIAVGISFCLLGQSVAVMKRPFRAIFADGIEIMPWADFLETLWGGKLLPA